MEAKDSRKAEGGGSVGWKQLGTPGTAPVFTDFYTEILEKKPCLIHPQIHPRHKQLVLSGTGGLLLPLTLKG